MKKGFGSSKNVFMFFSPFMLFISFMFFMAGRSSVPAQPQQKPPVFRTRIDLMQLDVTVLDKKGEPVRGLRKDDFTLLEDNKPQTIEGFTAVDVPERSVPGPAWDKIAAPDVATNKIDNSRIFVLVLDDALGVGCCTTLAEKVDPNHPQPAPDQGPDPRAARELRKTAELFIDALGPKDLAAVVFTGLTYRSNQSLTNDRAKLLTAVSAYPLNDGTLFLLPAGAHPIPQCLAAKQIIKMVDSVVTNLSTLPDRRKSIVYFGGSMPWGVAGGECGTYWMWQEVFTHAQQGNVTINPVQTAGLLEWPKPQSWNDRYLAVAENTGGHAVINTNDFAPGMRQIFLENSSYYLLAYQPTHDAADGTFRRVTVKVNRPDVEVRTRRSYWAPRETPPNKPAPEPPPPQVEALAGILPKSELTLRATAAPFAAPDGTATIAIALGVKQPPFANRTPEQVEVLIKAFDADAERASDTQMIPITVPAARADSDLSRYEVLAQIQVPKAMKYEVRLSAHSAASDTRGSVYVDVTVPDFKKDKLSLSGIVVNNGLSATPTAPLRLLRDVTPLVPTTERTFGAADIITTFARIYQGGSDKLAPVTMKMSIQDATGKSVFSQADTVGLDKFNADRAADYQFRLPLDKLTAGEYLLTFEAAAGKNTARRDVRFEKR